MQELQAAPPSKDIEKWQQAPDIQLGSGDVGIIGELFGACVECFNLALRAANEFKVGPSCLRTLRNTLASLFYWGEGFGAEQGKLDTALQQSEDLRDTVLSVLVSIGDLLSRGLLERLVASREEREYIARNSNINSLLEKAQDAIEDDSDDEEPSQYSTDDLKLLTKAIEMRVESLNDLNPSIRCPAIYDLHGEQARRPEDLDYLPYYQPYAEIILARFPQANHNLVQRLAECNWARYQRIQSQKEMNSREEYTSTDQRELKSLKSGFEDSGLGSSIPSNPEATLPYAQSIISSVSSRAGTSHRRLPKLSDNARKGEPFPCDACDKMVVFKRTKDWKSHIFQDLLPYVCIFDECTENLAFQNWDKFADHLGMKHGFEPAWKAKECPLCLETTPEGRGAISLHFARHLEEVALTVLPQDADSDVDSEIGSPLINVEDTNSTLPISPVDPIYPSLNNLSPALCEVCGLSIDFCGHTPTSPIHSIFTPSQFLSHPDRPGDATASQPTLSPQPLEPLASYTTSDVADNFKQQWDQAATTIDPSSMEEWRTLTYTPGDRTLQATSRKQQPRRGGFPCPYFGCAKIFDRQSDLKRHQKIHLNRSQRPHKCLVCMEGFLYLKDLDRHQKTHNRSSNARELLYCGVESCINIDGFSTEDNLKRHLRKQHGINLETSLETTSQVPAERSSSGTIPIKDTDVRNSARRQKITSGATAEQSSSNIDATNQMNVFEASAFENSRMAGNSITSPDELEAIVPTESSHTVHSLDIQKNPATFQCTLCPKRFTRAYNLRSHLRTHTDERPFVCSICGESFARQNDRKAHEASHTGESEFVCRGVLQNGNSWGCGLRFVDVDALGRHFRSEEGRLCIEPRLEEQTELLKEQEKLSTNMDDKNITLLPQIARSHPLYQAQPGKDDLYHCPDEGKPGCNHKPTKLKANYDKYVDSHLRPFRCKNSSCVGVQFSSTACLLRHEREAHGMHGHGPNPHLCPYPDCERSTPGNGFPRRYNLFDHLKRVHDYTSSTFPPKPSPLVSTNPKHAEPIMRSSSKYEGSIPSYSSAQSHDLSDYGNNDSEKAEAFRYPFELGVDPAKDPELALALRMAYVAEKRRQEREKKLKEATEGKAELQTPPPAEQEIDSTNPRITGVRPVSSSELEGYTLYPTTKSAGDRFPPLPNSWVLDPPFSTQSPYTTIDFSDIMTKNINYKEDVAKADNSSKLHSHHDPDSSYAEKASPQEYFPSSEEHTISRSMRDPKYVDPISADDESSDSK